MRQYQFCLARRLLVEENFSVGLLPLYRYDCDPFEKQLSNRRFGCIDLLLRRTFGFEFSFAHHESYCQ